MSDDEVDKLNLNNNKVDKKTNAWEKRKELVFSKGSWLIQHLQNVSHQKVYTFWHCVVNNEVPSTSFEIVKQIVLFNEYLYQEYLRWITQRQTRTQKNKHSFLQKKF